MGTQPKKTNSKKASQDNDAIAAAKAIASFLFAKIIFSNS